MGTKREELNPLTIEQALAAIKLQVPELSEFHALGALNALTAAGVVVCKPSAGCIGKADWDEPLFTLRAHDMLAPFLVRQWARMYYMLNTFAHNVASAVKPDLRLNVEPKIQRKHDEAMRCADAMDKWHNRALPD